ncbi:MAG: phosphoenolpyruvate carboxykinase [Planctomycetota bacterium]
MSLQRIDIERDQVVMHTSGIACNTAAEMVGSHAFARVVQGYVDSLRKGSSTLLDGMPLELADQEGVSRLVRLFRALAEKPLDQVVSENPDFAPAGGCRVVLKRFVEGLYDFWREHDRFLVFHSQPGPNSYDPRPYRAFNSTVEQLTHMVRGVYRDMCENITGDHPWVYRQVSAGCNVGMIATPRELNLPEPYSRVLREIPFIRQVWIDPPFIIDPPINKRTGSFQKVEKNPLAKLSLDASRFLCYPAQVGPLVIYIYFHQQFIGLGCALANLFELATEEQLARGPDAVYVYGAPSETMIDFGGLPTVFYDDAENGILAAAVPLEDRFGYFGYIKKMCLTLHNIVMMKRGRMPYHGAMTRIVLKSGAAANLLMIGDTATGKSESLEAFRSLGEDQIRELTIIADDMGSLEIDAEGRVLGYGTEIGAFIRLDDLQQGYAFGQIDRAIIMSPQKINARVVLPVTSLAEVLRGYPVDFILYANNYEEVDDDHPIIEPFANAEQALKVFREGAAMSKGTTTSTGLTHSYFGNIFGAPQYKDLHEPLAQKTFEAAFKADVFLGQMRTRLGINGYESRGPEEAARAMFALIEQRHAERCGCNGQEPGRPATANAAGSAMFSGAARGS